MYTHIHISRYNVCILIFAMSPYNVAKSTVLLCLGVVCSSNLETSNTVLSTDRSYIRAFCILHCIVVLQDHDDSIDNTNDFPLPYLRNGDNTNTQQYNARATGTKNETQSQMNNRMTNAVEQDRVIHESWMNYDRCYQRERNRSKCNEISSISISKVLLP